MSKVVFLGLPAIGHINPTIGVVKELIAHGEEVIYYNTPEFQSRIVGMGAEFRAYPFETSESGNNIIGCNNVLQEMKIDGIHALNLLGQKIMWKMVFYVLIMNNPKFNLKNEITELNPDYLIHDSCAYWGKVLTRELNIPAVTSVTTFAYCDNMLEQYPDFVVREILDFPELIVDPASTRKVLGRISRMIGSLLKIDDFDCIDMSFSQEALNLVFTSREFQWYGHVFDDTFKFIGPSIYPRNDSDGFPWDRLNGNDLIYISLGTLLQNQDLYQKCFMAFGDSNKQVVLNIGTNHPDDLGTVPDNFIISNFVPQLELLKRTDLFITHGGMNSVNEALYFSVPLIVIPQRWDQYMVSKRVAELGVGINMKNMEFNAFELFDASTTIFTCDIYHRQSSIFGESLRSTGGYKRAAAEIFRFKVEKGIK